MSAWAGFLFAAAAGSAVACPLGPQDGTRLHGAGVQLAWSPADAQVLQRGRHFALTVRVCPEEVALVKVDAVMPAHRHGMNYRPTIAALGAGRWRVDGLMWHMSGAWELQFDLRSKGQVQTLRQHIDLP